MVLRLRLQILLIIALLFSGSTSWAVSRPDTSIFNPDPSISRYLNTRQAENLRQWKFAGGFFIDYGNAPLKVVNLGNGATQNIVTSQFIGHVTGAVGFTDWFQLGLDIPLLMYEKFSNPNATGVTGGPTQTFAGKLGDIKAEAQFQILDVNRYNIGVAIAPFAQFATGKKDIYFSNEQTTGGVRLIVEGKVKNRAWFSGNFGYQYLKFNNYFAGDPVSGNIGSLLLFGVGGNVKLGKGFSVLGELAAETVASNAFKSMRQTPVTLLGGVRYTLETGPMQGLQFTLAAGSGITKGVGAPKGEGILSIAYRRPNVVRLPELSPSNVDAKADEKILITQKIHFEFNKSIIRPISYPILDDVVQLLKLNPQIKRIQVEGHTDAIGGDTGNQRLSESRAKAVVAYLVSKGVAHDRLSAIGYGRSRPIADNATAEGRAKNRRTEFTVLE